MKRLLVTFLFTGFFLPGKGQLATNSVASFSAEWHEGMVTFDSGDTLSCDLRYNNALPVGVLQINASGTILTIAPEDVTSFSWYDEKRRRMRRYYSLTVTTEELSTHRTFMECLYYDSEISILNHKTLGLPYEYMTYTRFVSKPSRVNRRYIFQPSTGELLPMSRENALKVVEDKSEVMSFIESHRIRFRSLEDYIDVFRYYANL